MDLFSNMAVESQLASSLQELFYQSMQSFPNNVAIACSGEELQSMTYRDLGQTVKQLARFFKELFLRNEVIGVYFDQNIFLPTVLLAILESSAAFYPFATSLASWMVLDRLRRHNIRYVLMESSLVERFLITKKRRESEVSTHVESDGLEILVPEDEETLELLNRVQVTLFKVLGCEKCVVEWREDIAYVMQTSGTTGEPKAVFVPHSCILPNIVHLSSLFQVTHQDIVFLASPYTFDPCIVQMFLALANGATLLLLPHTEKLIPHSLCSKLFDQHKVTIFQPTPSLLYYIGEDLILATILCETSCLSVLALGGESCPPLSTLARWKHPRCTTRLYNIYGITEVSSWATCYEISDQDLRKATSRESRSNLVDHCPLGLPLANTRLSLYDEHGVVISGDGVGHLWIGGHDRKCLLEGESLDAIPLMRKSGDIVEVRHGQMRHIGRSDNQMKRFGTLINLDYIEKQVVLPHNGTNIVSSCAVVVQPTTVGCGLLHFFVTLTTHSNSECEKISLSILQEHLKLVLPRAAQPDSMHIVAKLPLTNHGKVNKRHLLSSLNTQSVLHHHTTIPIRKALAKMWLDCCHNSFDVQNTTIDGEVLDGQSMFVLQGGDSMLAVRLADAIEQYAMNRWGALLNMALLVDVIVNKPFADLVTYVQGQVSETTVTSIPNALFEEQTPSITKKLKTDNEHEFLSSSIDVDGVDSMGLKNDTSLVSKSSQQHNHFGQNSGHGRVVCLQCEDHAKCTVFNPILTHGEDSTFNFKKRYNIAVKWRTSLKKCIDASPLVVVSSCLVADGEVYIGSHSHLFMAVSLASGEVKWRITLGGRIESSCCLSLCAKLVVVGCYDGKVYVISRHDGAVVWTHQTGNTVKSSPCLDRRTGYIWVGSHDGNLYALDLQHQSCPITVHCLGGSCFSSPVISYDPHRVFVGTLAGYFLCIDATTGSIVWHKQFDKPIFGSPLVHDGKISVATVDGSFKCFDHHGNALWEFLTNAPIFSSPCALSVRASETTEPRLIIGSHDHNIYCVSYTGKLQWSSQLGGPIYSTPCVKSCTSLRDKLRDVSVIQSVLCFVISTKGTLYVLDANDGSQLTTFVFPGEVFSSPALVGDLLVVGCRDDFLYCLKPY